MVAVRSSKPTTAANIQLFFPTHDKSTNPKVEAACKNPEIGACVIFYGGFPGVTPEIASLTSPVLGLYAGKDTFVTVASVHQLEQILQHHQKPYSFHIYSDADHAFFNDTRPEVYREADARDAWERVLAFYQAHLWGGHQG